MQVVESQTALLKAVQEEILSIIMGELADNISSYIFILVKVVDEQSSLLRMW